MEFRVLGPVEVWAAGRAVDAGPPRQRAMLAALAVDAGRTVPVATLVDRVWGDAPPERARNAVQVCINRVRHLLGKVEDPPVRLVHRSGGYVLDVEPGSVDVHRFRALVERAGDRDRTDPERVALLREALDLWRGTPLADLTGDWAGRVREGWQRLRLDAVVAWAQAEVRLGNAGTVIGPLTELTGEYPLVEPLTAVLIRALHAAGRGAEALDTYAKMRQRLVEELGTDPGPELLAIHQALLRGRPAPPSAAVPAQLPLDVRGFTGRERELSRLDGILATAGEQPTAPTAVVISALWGTAGVGKTALAVHWAHRVAERFPDGQLYVNLRGFDPSGPAMTPAEAVRGFLDALGAAPHQIPVSLSAQVGLYRSLLAGKRVLVALDNAASAEQVRPLLPGAPGCLVVVTSRNQLTSLVAAEGARPLPLDLLTPDEARQLLTRRLGVDRVAAEPSAVAEIVALCAGLPLALAIVAARAATQPEYALADLAAELRGLDTLSGGDAATDVRAVFSWSYQALGGTAARLFRLLGLHPGPDIARDAAASLAGEPVDALLAELAGAHLVAVQTPGRYSFHDLLRAYAVEQAHAVDSEADRRAAVRRLVDYYVQTAHAAAVAVQPHRDLGSPPDAAGGVTPTPLDAAPPALDWFTAEHAVLMGILDRAVREGFDLHAWHLAWVLMTFFDLRGHWHDWADAARVALGAAERLGDRPRVAQSHRGVAGAYTQLGRYEDAYEHYRRAYLIYGELGDVMGQGRTSLTLSQVFDRQARYREALSHGEQALSFFRAAGHTVGQARALNAIGWYHAQLHDYEQALACCEPALELLREVGDQRGTAETWDSIGYAQHHLGRYAEAVSSYRNAIALCRELGDRYHEASCLNHLGDTYLAAGDADAARRAWQAALDIHGRLDRPGGDELRAKLAALAPSPAPAG